MRLVTRGDLDELTAAVLITEMEEVDEILLAVCRTIRAEAKIWMLETRF